MIAKTTSRICAALGVAFVMALGAPQLAGATESPYDTPDVRAFFAEYGVDPDTQDALIASMESGDMIDALKAGQEPVSSTTQIRDGFEETVLTYADGSVGVTALEIPQPAPTTDVSARAISGCTVNSGAGWASSSNCKVSHSAAYATLSFYANYQQTASGGTISNPRNGEISATFGSVSNKSLKLIRANSTSSQPAVATLHGYWSSSSVAEDLYLSLRVNAGGGWTTTY